MKKVLFFCDFTFNPKWSSIPNFNYWNKGLAVEIDFSEVVAEGMIKKEIVINPEIDKEKIGNGSADNLVIACAIKKRKELVVPKITPLRRK